MTKATRQYPASFLSAEMSRAIIRALGTWQAAKSLTDYDLAAIAGVSRDTIGRWRRHSGALTARTIDRLVAGIAEHDEATSAARAELERILAAALSELAAAENDPAERLRRRLNSKRLRGSSVLAEIEAIGLRVVAEEGA